MLLAMPDHELSDTVLKLALDHLYEDRSESVSDLRQEFNHEINRIRVMTQDVPREKAQLALESLLDHSRMIAGNLPDPAKLNEQVLNQRDIESARGAAYRAVRSRLGLW